MTKDEMQETWSGEQDVSNVAQLKVQADKWAGLWHEGMAEWDIRQAGTAVGGVPIEAPLTAEELRSASKSFKKRTTSVEGWRPRHFAGLSDVLLGALGKSFALWK